MEREYGRIYIISHRSPRACHRCRLPASVEFATYRKSELSYLSSTSVARLLEINEADFKSGFGVQRDRRACNHLASMAGSLTTAVSEERMWTRGVPQLYTRKKRETVSF